MCLILVAWQQHPEFPLIVAANRDEFYARPTAVAAQWLDLPHVYGGRDLEAGGTWLGVSDTGRFAAVTNVREPGQPPGERSRGYLTRDFLAGNLTAPDFARQLQGERYAGFNLLVSDGTRLSYASNRGGDADALLPGIYGVSNHLLDTPWPKLTASKQRFAAAVAALPDENGFFALLADTEIVPDAHLPKTGVPLPWERLLSAVFVRSPEYGTRASTLLLLPTSGVATLVERSYSVTGEIGETRLKIGLANS